MKLALPEKVLSPTTTKTCTCASPSKLMAPLMFMANEFVDALMYNLGPLVPVKSVIVIPNI